MTTITLILLIATAIISGCVYAVLRLGITLLLPLTQRTTLKQLVATAVLLALAQALLYMASISIPHDFWSNRVQHAVAGGVFAVAMWYVVSLQAHILYTRLQFFVASILVVTFLGVGYELLECAGELLTGFAFQTAPYDTWYDLASNLTGAIVGGAIGAFVYPHITRHTDTN